MLSRRPCAARIRVCPFSHTSQSIAGLLSISLAVQRSSRCGLSNESCFAELSRRERVVTNDKWWGAVCWPSDCGAFPIRGDGCAGSVSGGGQDLHRGGCCQPLKTRHATSAISHPPPSRP